MVNETPLGQITTPDLRFSPYPPRKTKGSLTPVIGSPLPVTSQTPMPVKGYSLQTTKGVPKEYSSAARIISLLESFALEHAVEADVSAWLEEAYKKKTLGARSYSALTEEDTAAMLPKGFGGLLEIRPDDLPKEFPDDFWPGLARLRRTLSRQVEAGCRPVIAWFLAAAVEQARIIFNDPRLAVHSEVPIPSVTIPNVGFVGGKLGFMTADVRGEGPMDVIMESWDARRAYIDKEKPSFIIVEAKRASTLPEGNSEAELIGQLKSHIIRNGTTSHYGALTDGKEWRFYMVDGERAFMNTILADSRENTIMILGTLTLLSAGRAPVRDSTAPIWY